MATTFFVFELGFAPAIDTVEGNQTSENQNALNGLSFGSATDPVAHGLRSLSPAAVSGPGADGDAGSYNPDNAIADEQFQIDGGAPRSFDALMVYANTVITYTDGTTATVEALIMQDTDGRIYLVPSSTGPNAYTDALAAKPIAAITLGTAQPALGTNVYGMYADRFVLDIDDYTVEGTENADLIDGAYTGDPEGDRVDNADNFEGDDDDRILAYGGDDTVLSGAGDDTVEGGGGSDSIEGGDGDDLIRGDGAGTVDAVVVAHEDFTGGATGWTNNTTSDDTEFGEFLGRFQGSGGDSSGGPLTQKTFDLAGGYEAVVLEFDLLIIDSWDSDKSYSSGPDNDAFQLYINGQQVANELFQWDVPAFAGDRSGTITLDGVTYTYSFTLTQSGDLAYSSNWGDQIWRVRLEAENYTTDQITIGFGSTTDQGLNDESFGIDNLTIVSTNDTTIDIADAAGDDVLLGGTGADTLDGGAGSDTLIGGDGNDLFIGSEGADSIDGGATWWDVVDYSGSDGAVTINLADTLAESGGHAEGDTLTGIEQVVGSSFDDVFVASASGTSFVGDDGNDTFSGGVGDDRFWGGAGDDVMYTSGSLPFTGTGDLLEGQADADTFIVTDGFGDATIIGGDDVTTGVNYDTIDLSAVTNPVTVTFTGNGAGTITDTVTGNDLTFSGIERLILNDASDVVDATPNGAGIDIIAAGGDDSITGGAGDDGLSGGAGVDTAVFTGPVTDYSFAFGPGGSLIVTDTVPDRDGQDTLNGFEYVTFGGVTYHLVTGDAGDNTTLQAPDDGTPSLIIAHDGNDWGGGHATSDVVFGGAGQDTLDGGEGDDTLVGEDGDDLLRGDGGDDQLLGGSGKDTLAGGTGNDRLDGGEGDDSLDAGPGADTVTGGSGNDTFAYAVGDGLLTITDFNFGNTGTLDDGDATNNDFIDLSGFYDNITELYDDYDDDGILNQSNAGNTISGQTVDYSDNTAFAPGDGIIFQGATADGTSFTQENTGVICFTPGTLILTDMGECPVEDLRPGDRIVTRDNGLQTLQWLAQRRIDPAELAANDRLRPVLIRPELIGAEAPLLVSPQHGMLVRTDTGDETLVRAIHLARRPGGKARVARGLQAVTYIHLMFDAHQIVFANGAPSESFYPGPMALAALSDPARDELRAIFPALFTAPTARVFGPRARTFTRPRDLPPKLHDLWVA